MKLAKDQSVLHLSRSAYDKLSREAKEALQVYSEHFWWTRSGLCFVVADYRLDELQALAAASVQTSANRVQAPGSPV